MQAFYPTEFENEFIKISDNKITIKMGASIENIKLSMDIYKAVCRAIDEFNYENCPWIKKDK